MAITYKKLFHLLIDREMTPAELQKEAGYSANISTRLRRDHYVSLEVLRGVYGKDMSCAKLQGR